MDAAQATRAGDKRKQELEHRSTQRPPTGRYHKVRGIFMGKAATEIFYVDDLSAVTLRDLLAAIAAQAPAIFSTKTLCDEALASRAILLLREVATVKERRFSAIDSRDEKGYVEWRQRRALETSSRNMAIEVHRVGRNNYGTAMAELIAIGNGDEADDLGTRRRATGQGEPLVLSRTSGRSLNLAHIPIPVGDIRDKDIERYIRHGAALDQTRRRAVQSLFEMVPKPASRKNSPHRGARQRVVKRRKKIATEPGYEGGDEAEDTEGEEEEEEKREASIEYLHRLELDRVTMC